MRFSNLLFLICSICWGAVATNNNLTDLVEWDQYSLTVDGSRVFIYSGEFHYQRLPVPELWPDILQKFKASGFNAISIYVFWSYHSPQKGVFDFENGAKNLQRLFDYAKQIGLYVIPRAGPYCNAETNGGGLALYGSDGSFGNLRTSDEAYHQAWLPYITRVGEIIAANQITRGGPVILNQIENEFTQTVYSPDHTSVKYMIQIEKAFRDAGVIVPFTHNEKGMRGQSWSTDYKNVGGAVDIYGLDSYPGGLSCTNPNTGFNVVRTYYQWFQNYSWTQPSYVPEFEGGWFSGWGAGTFYDDCQSEHDPAFADVYYKNNIGQHIVLQNIYMAFGGTNWGHSAAPVVYTSYDYSAPLRETRQIWDKMSQTKLIGLFTRVSEGLLHTVMAGNGTGYSVSSSSIWTWHLKNTENNGSFYITQQSTSKSTSSVKFSASLATSLGKITADNVSLQGRQSRILVTDYSLGGENGNALLYCTSDIAAYGNFGKKDVLVLYLKEGQTGEFSFVSSSSNLTFTAYGGSTISSTTNSADTQSFVYTQASGSTAVQFSNGVLVYLLEQKTAWRFWAPPTTTNPNIQPDEQIFVLGPYLVRSAALQGRKLVLTGDSDNATTIEVFTGTQLDSIVWNGKELKGVKTTAYGSATAPISGGEDRSISLPDLEALDWVTADGLPEADPDYDDSNWAVCNKNTTLSPTAPTTLPVLFSSDYGFYAGTKVYRGYFPTTASGNTSFTKTNITCSGGLAFGWSVWLNGEFLGSDPGTTGVTTSTLSLALPANQLRKDGKDNVLTVVVDYTGHDQTSTAKGVENPRGILGALLLPGGTATKTGFTQWKLVGAAGEGAAKKVVDPMRGPMNEGGLYGERLGWHLPGFKPPQTWASSSPLTGLDAAGISFYAASFKLEIPSDLDVPLGIEFSVPADTTARVMFWINGYQYGKYVPHIGPQTRFPIPPGILDTRGDNWIVVSLWAQKGTGAKLEGMKLFSYGVYETALDIEEGKGTAYLRPGLDKGREVYA